MLGFARAVERAAGPEILAHARECRLIQASQTSLPWRPELCASCEVPAVLRANGSPHLRLQLTVRKRLRWFTRMELRAWCTAHSRAIDDPYRCCPLCLQDMLGGGPRRLGVEYMEIGEQLASFFKLPGKSGVLVSSVDADGPAAKGGMKAGEPNTCPLTVKLGVVFTRLARPLWVFCFCFGISSSNSLYTFRILGKTQSIPSTPGVVNPY